MDSALQKGHQSNAQGDLWRAISWGYNAGVNNGLSRDNLPNIRAKVNQDLLTKVEQGGMILADKEGMEVKTSVPRAGSLQDLM